MARIYVNLSEVVRDDERVPRIPRVGDTVTARGRKWKVIEVMCERTVLHLED